MAMGKLFTVGFISLFDNELIVEIVLASDWKDALCKHSKITGEGMDEFKEDIPDSLEDAKQYFFDCDMAMDVKGIN